MAEITKLNAVEKTRPLPARIVRPCEHGLVKTIMDMETQLGSIEAFNMLVKYASVLKVKIDNGKAVAQNAYYSTHPRNAE